jgi:hypothetical protein
MIPPISVDFASDISSSAKNESLNKVAIASIPFDVAFHDLLYSMFKFF